MARVASKGRIKAASEGRPERTGPSNSLSVEWKTAMKRVRPPSTRISKTPSDSRMPDWGRAFQWLSTLTARTLRSSVDGSSMGSPLMGERGRSSMVVVGASEVVVGAEVVVGTVVVVVLLVVSVAPPLHPASTRASTTTGSRIRIGGMLGVDSTYSARDRTGDGQVGNGAGVVVHGDRHFDSFSRGGEDVEGVDVHVGLGQLAGH